MPAMSRDVRGSEIPIAVKHVVTKPEQSKQSLVAPPEQYAVPMCDSASSISAATMGEAALRESLLDEHPTMKPTSAITADAASKWRIIVSTMNGLCRLVLCCRFFREDDRQYD